LFYYLVRLGQETLPKSKFGCHTQVSIDHSLVPNCFETSKEGLAHDIVCSCFQQMFHRSFELSLARRIVRKLVPALKLSLDLDLPHKFELPNYFVSIQ
jgi:hypothetical protein